MFFFAKPGLSVFHQSTAEKNICFLLQTGERAANQQQLQGAGPLRQNTVAAVKGGVGTVGGVAGSILGRAVFIKFLGKEYLRSPSLSTWILRGLEAAQARAKKQHFFRV